MTERTKVPPGIPGWRRELCLGCNGRMTATRDAHVTIVGRRDGSTLIFIGVGPQKSYLAGNANPSRPLEVLGVAHREHMELAKNRLEAQQVSFQQDLPPAAFSVADPAELPRLDRPPVLDRCAFCDNSGTMSEEHVWAEQIGRFLNSHGVVFGPRKRPLIDAVVDRNICESCNNGWLSVIEKDVWETLKPLLWLENAQTLTPEDQRALATWAYGRALVIGLWQGHGDLFIPLERYVQFYQDRKPPSNAYVWMGAYGGRGIATAWRQPRRVGIPNTEPPNAFAITFTAGSAVFQVWAPLSGVPSRISETPAFAAAVPQIWPLQSDPLAWPPEGIPLDDNDLDALVER